MRSALLLPALLAACGGTPSEKMSVTMPREQADLCYVDAPTGTRFTKVKCPTPDQEDQRRRHAEDAKETIRQVRHAPLGDPR
jgi:hypothetical protein